jgi:outer membrane usher protein
VVTDARGSEVGLTGQGGRIYLRGVPDSGVLTVSWGDEPGQNCSFAYRLPAKQIGNDPFLRLESTCTPSTLAGLP